MSNSASSTPSLTPSRSPTPEAPVQPDHFFGNDNHSAASSPNGKPWLDPADDPLAQRGIPVFKPTMEEFKDFEGYMNKIERWGLRSGIVKVIPPKEWTDSLPSVKPQLRDVKLKNPIEQHMLGHGGLFRQQNIEKRRHLSVREWAELCGKEELRAPGKDEIELRSGVEPTRKPRRGVKKDKDLAVDGQEQQPEVVVVKDEHELEDGIHVTMDVDQDMKHDGQDISHNVPSNVDQPALAPSPNAVLIAGEEAGAQHVSVRDDNDGKADAQEPERLDETDEQGPRRKGRGKQAGASKEAREAQIAERAAKDAAFLEDFNPLEDWLPPKTANADYNLDFCNQLERRYWRNCGLGKAPWYGADMQGSLFTDATTSWNVAHLPSTLSRLLPSSSKGLPGVNTPYLYFGMWRATFAWHVEDMDLFSINYIHFGAPKYWYAMPQERAGALERTMRDYFARDTMQCPQFLRHKSFLASPGILGRSSCKPNTLVQRQGEFVITYPKGYHAGFNLGFNCAESVNFALDSWLDLGRKAKICQCVNYSVRIDIDQLLADREAERAEQGVQAVEVLPPKPKRSHKKRKAPDISEPAPNPKKLKIRISSSSSNENADNGVLAASVPAAKPKVWLKLGPQPKEEPFPCCLCVSFHREGLLRVLNPPLRRKEGFSGSGKDEVWMAHEECANVVPESWVDEVDVGVDPHTGAHVKEKVVFGVDGIVKDRWNLKCSACSKTKHKAHGAPIQCTKGRCPKAFHVSCAREGAINNIVYTITGIQEKEVVVVGQPVTTRPADNISITPVQQPLYNMPMMPLLPPGQQYGQWPQDPGAQWLTPPGPNSVDPSTSAQSQSQVEQPVKVVKKLEVCVLCSQHNPALTDAKKANRQEKIKNALFALPAMARIKLRVSAGVFEVTLVRVIEETGSVEVLWDRGIKRDFKWGSVVFGKTDEVVGHKPAEPASGPNANRPGPPMPPMKALTSAAANGSSMPFPPLQNTTGTIEIRQTQPSTYQHHPLPPAQNAVSLQNNHGIKPYHIPDHYLQQQQASQPRKPQSLAAAAPTPAAGPPPAPIQMQPVPPRQQPYVPPYHQPHYQHQAYPSYHWNYQYSGPSGHPYAYHHTPPPPPPTHSQYQHPPPTLQPQQPFQYSQPAQQQQTQLQPQAQPQQQQQPPPPPPPQQQQEPRPQPPLTPQQQPLQAPPQHQPYYSTPAAPVTPTQKALEMSEPLQVQQQTVAPASSTPRPPQQRSTARGLQWQRPYTGPKDRD